LGWISASMGRTKPGTALVIGADTGPWLRLVQYERIARAEGNALNLKIELPVIT